MRPGPDVAPEVDVASASSRRTASRTDTVDEPDSFALDTISGIIRSRPSTGCSPVRYSSSTAGRNPTPEPSATSSRALVDQVAGSARVQEAEQEYIVERVRR